MYVIVPSFFLVWVMILHHDAEEFKIGLPYIFVTL